MAELLLEYVGWGKYKILAVTLKKLTFIDAYRLTLGSPRAEPETKARPLVGCEKAGVQHRGVAWESGKPVPATDRTDTCRGLPLT